MPFAVSVNVIKTFFTISCVCVYVKQKTEQKYKVEQKRRTKYPKNEDKKLRFKLW